MTLAEASKGEKVIVKKIDANDALKQRLFSFGLVKGVEVEVVDCSLGKSVIELKVGNTLFALRKEEAQKIEVEALNKKRKRHRWRFRGGWNAKS